MLGICCKCLKKIADTANRCPHCGNVSPFRDPPMSVWKKATRWFGKWCKRFGKLTSQDWTLILFFIWAGILPIVIVNRDYWKLMSLTSIVVFFFWWKRRLKTIDDKVKYEEARDRGRQRRKKKNHHFSEGR